MSLMNYRARVFWKKQNGTPFIDRKYSRKHKWIFDGGMELDASSSPQVVPLPMSDQSAIDPEEALIASVSSCHMLFFLSIAADEKYVVECYEDDVEGLMSKNDDGKIFMKSIALNPRITFGNRKPTSEKLFAMHQLSHAQCYIANSLKSEISIINR